MNKWKKIAQKKKEKEKERIGNCSYRMSGRVIIIEKNAKFYLDFFIDSIGPVILNIFVVHIH